MKTIYIWIGYFPTEKDFENYLNQSAFRKWWKDNDEDNLDLCCDFCKEMGIADYDEDFAVIKYNRYSSDMNDLYGLIPAKEQTLTKVIAEKDITKANALICYNVGEDIDTKNARLTKQVKFLGKFEFDASVVYGAAPSLAGLHNMLWLGKTSKTESEFMRYFNQSEYLNALQKFEKGEIKKRPSPDLRCQFCKDLNINYYYPEYLTVFHSPKEMKAEDIIKNHTKDPELFYSMTSYTVDDLKIKSSNAMFLYIPNGKRDKKKNQNITIFRKAMIGKKTKPKGALDELDNYNDLSYIGTFAWD
jgi:hypothetical protein